LWIFIAVIDFSAFGFCEYKDPESALRAIHILHDYKLGDKKLLVRYVVGDLLITSCIFDTSDQLIFCFYFIDKVCYNYFT